MSPSLRLPLAAMASLLPALAAGYAYSTATPDDKIQQNQVSGQAVIWHIPQQSLVFNFGTTFDDNAKAAMEEWNAVGTPLQYQLGSGAETACNGSDRVNSAAWGYTTCLGQPFGDAIAVTRRNYEKIGSSWYLTDTGILFDRSRKWSPNYSGPLRRDAISGEQLQDFRRVILHELGHALGLDHPDEAGQTVTAIMNSKTSDIDTLQADDRNGISKLYSGTSIGTGNTTNLTASGDGGGGGGGDLGLPMLALAARLIPRLCRRTPRIARARRANQC